MWGDTIEWSRGGMSLVEYFSGIEVVGERRGMEQV
jgi:hypothetical protein